MQEGLTKNGRPAFERYPELFVSRVKIQARLCALMTEGELNREKAEMDWTLRFMDKFAFVFRDHLDEVKEWHEQKIDPSKLSREELQSWIDDLESRDSYAGAA